MVILLSLTESQEQLIAGFPEYVVLTTNVPATIFYTLDGTTPNENSEIFLDRIVLPTNGTTIKLRAIAVVGLFTSAVLGEDYFTDHSQLGKTRLIGKEGINVLPPGSIPVDNLSYNAAGDIAQASRISFSELDIRASTSNSRGENIPGDTTIDFIQFPLKSEAVINPDELISSPNDNINFNPRASYIVIDGTTPEAINNQVVKIINRPHATMDLLSKINTRNPDEYQLSTSGFVRYMINPRTGDIVFYYRESRENRWIKSTQRVEGKGLNLTPFVGSKSKFVFRWIEERAQSKIY